MPRIPTKVLIKAYQETPLLPLLLQECRTLVSARNELRWLRERALRDSQSSRLGSPGWRTRLRSMCQQRSRGVPLQYILGDQPFGDLEILCQRGVLIPRSDTESYTFQAAKRLRQMALESKNDTPSPRRRRPLRVLDLCTGTGCIALLLHALLAPNFQDMQILGIDISPTALKLAQRNLAHNMHRALLTDRALTQIHFHRADVLGVGDESAPVPTTQEVLQDYFPRLGNPGGSSEFECDLLISNPPYISTADFRNGTTSRSVRRFEPRLALVPPSIPQSAMPEDCNMEDIFYHRILTLSLQSQAKLTVLECGDIMQAHRVVAMYQTMTTEQAKGFTMEVWPSSEQDLAANGFHPHDGSRCVIIQRVR
ncbi:uncharacterized protein N7484_001695 [Penicillium longicatenatum]|uniref:uncharacterized protein n=1 Tax=Penicillium longicatenatum TaxID=1561947 RepID=UPI002547FA1C|nr:uncharacterized protein N7484_001695 [Penicillium longicatenatum]KAJ5658046.1 hypothetical protein N7484_001695 [Penicillium longicatenatum]